MHLATILVVGGLVATVTSSCGSNAEQAPPVEVPEAGPIDVIDASVPADAEGLPDTGPFLDAGPCVPQTIDCTGKCGPIRDACSGEVTMCGGCATGEVCDLQLHTCGVPKTQCSDFGAECGQVKTSCGQYIACGSCPAGQECNPDTNKCQTSQAVTCQDLGYECGAAWLGSGDPTIKTNCGTCKDPNKNRCNLTFNVCEPTCPAPQGAAAKKAFCDAARQTKGVECGVISDGCGGTIDCSLSQGFSCPAGQGCGVRGVANRCEPFPTPPECEALGKNCGTLVSACDGKTISCGVCGNSGEVCNDNGVCGPPCTSTTCAQALPAGQECGSVSDGCKGTLNCACPSGGKCLAGGTCCQPKKCADLITAGQCGKKLDDGCGGKINSCPCPSGEVCPAADGAIATCCTPKTCADFPGQCGKNLDNGCGGVIQCGCSGGNPCIVGGPPGTAVGDNQPGTCCPETGCAPGSCNTTVNSVCITGKTFTCNTCPNGQVCDGTSCCAPTAGCNATQCNTTVDRGCGLPPETCGCDLPSTCTGTTCTCDPYTCGSPQYAGKCGVFSNGCNGAITCDPCAPGEVCSTSQTCCTKKTCAGDYPGQCGSLPDGCGRTLNCDPCSGSGQVCNGGSCCTPKTCAADYAGQCGTFSNGCGGNLQCNPCSGGQVCQGNTCCTKLTCNSPQYVGKCGSFSNGCGGTLNCGCTGGFNTCGGGGVPNVCGCTPQKAPADCAGRVGTFPDGCGGQFTCTG
jgi:hypothetical protein